MISVNDVTMNFGARMLFESVNVTFNAGERYGLTGPNGSGKSTFMKILSHELEPMAGHVRLPRRFGILRQDHTAFDAHRVIDVVMMGSPALWAAMSEKEQLLAKGDALTDDDGVRLGELEGVIAEEDGYTAEIEATALLEGLGIAVEYHTQLLSVLQGGDKVRVLLAQALFGKPEALLLDEPTNALDIASIRWLEGFLEDFTGALVVISHDRHFLNEVCTKIADIDYETIIVYNGNYDDMVSAKAEARTSLELANAAKQKKISQLQEFVQRFRAGSRASQVKSREKQLGREQKALSDLKRSNIARPFVRFELKRPSGKQVLNVEALTKRFGDTAICDHFNLSLFRGDRVALVGRNGIGKTSLMRLLLGELGPDAGKVEWGYEAQLGYLPQDHHELVKKSKQTAHEWLWSWNKDTDEENLRALFGRLLFSKDEPLKPTEVLSGGETVRLLIARLMLLKPNVLLLDEPTNHLDLEAIRSLTEALARYEGTCVFITHDRQMVSQVATRVLELSEAGITELTPEQFHEGQFLLNAVRYQKPSGGWQ
ncbi:MAG TPA: ATP-binding cassette domain-containing protein [Polyangiaceae bacterium]|nr:ATP-binding cassette domain-containing protein [Polyangiaceae bacterium]